MIRGRVQRVGFRFFTLQHAKNLGLTGWVKNIPTGNVKVLVQGTQSKIDFFLIELKKGPINSFVEMLEVNQVGFNPKIKSFELRF